MSIAITVSPGEFLDKLSILQIKAQRIRDAAKLANVRRELAELEAAWAASPYAARDLGRELDALRAVNETLWDVEDGIRAKEARAEFDAEFVELARAVYLHNDERARIKRRINELLGSELVEEKSYADYRRDP